MKINFFFKYHLNMVGNQKSNSFISSTFKQLITEVKKFAQNPRHKNSDSAILSILSHGENGKVIGEYIRFVFDTH